MELLAQMVIVPSFSKPIGILIVSKDVVEAVIQFFISSWIIPNMNANKVVLIPKKENSDSIGHYRLIALANFKYKIISKILADRLAQILPSIISKEQTGFVKGRQIKDCICLTSEIINMLHKKSYGGNLAIKIDIAKAFDTIDWNFLLNVLKAFGFHSTFCNWIKVILESAKLSISINGKQEGYFSCSRGVRQGDPLSPLLFCLAEEVFSRGITNLVNSGHLKLIQ
ncbi:ribonuclease H, partial [Trifolium pratense]